ncbi:MAG: aminoglycoside 3'-phosphotransferase [Lachnospiraceae bacterium]|nr:aminoglycoside 3'-phosphotransferase [Lachnospiraceae bacterium]
MKKTLLNGIPNEMPRDIQRFVSAVNIYDTSCSPEAKVYFIDKGNGYYLKCSDSGMLEKEFKMTEYFYSKGLGAEVLSYISDNRDWLLTRAVIGEDCVHEKYLMEPKRLCDTIAYELRKLHETDYSDCPIPDRTAEYLAVAEKNYCTGNYDKLPCPDSFSYRSAKEAYDVLTAEKGALQNKVLLHGDYCLPNIVLNNWNLSGFIDVGNGGVGDRHIDIFWGIWSLWFNLKTDKYQERFLDAYGRDKADESILKIVAAAEVFG